MEDGSERQQEGGSKPAGLNPETTANGLLSELASLVEVARQHAVAIQGAKAVADSMLEGMQAKDADISSVGTLAAAAKAQITDVQAVIATKSDHIQNAQTHADKVRAELDRIQTEMTAQATESEGSKTRAQVAADGATDLLAKIVGNNERAEADVATIIKARDSAKEAAAQTKKLADTSATVEKRVQDYEAQLAQLEQECRTQLEEIKRLLPGATAAGLAHSFDQRRSTFLKPARRWQWLFVGSIAALVFLASSGLWTVLRSGAPLSYDELVRLWLARLPIAGALVWLAIHASRESALAKRLEEDYGYKAAVAASFQGFQKQMADIGATTLVGSPLSKLCEDTLATIASPPGRIYDKHRLTASPADEAVAAAKSVIGNKATAK